MKSIIVVVTPDNEIKVFTRLTKVCKVCELKYHTLKKKKFPIDNKGYYIQKLDIIR